MLKTLADEVVAELKKTDAAAQTKTK